MKHIKYYIIALLALPLMAACSEDDYNAPTPTGNPVMSYSAPTTAVWMGEEVEVKVDCKDEAGVALPMRSSSRTGSAPEVEGVRGDKAVLQRSLEVSGLLPYEKPA